MSAQQQTARVAVFGMGRSGVAAANLLARRGTPVRLSDTRAQEAVGAALDGLHPDVEVVFGHNSFEGAAYVVLSPGLKPSLPIFEALRQAGIPAISEVELAWRHCPSPLVAITGTDGKTTTTSLLGDIMRAHFEHVVVGGNIGTPLCEVVEDEAVQRGDSVVVAEISAFQLWSSPEFRAAASGVTNIAADHLDYFDGDMDAYAEAKRVLVRHAQAEDCVVLHAADRVVSTWAEGVPGRVIWYALDADALPADAPDAFWAEDGALHARLGGQPIGPWLTCSQTALVGPHNWLNMMCAAGVAVSQGVPLGTVAQACRTFAPLAHRMQRLGTLSLDNPSKTLTFWDDSKATNAHAALAGLRGLHGPIVPIVGGVDKGLDLTDLVEHLAQRAAHIVLIGQLTDRLHDALAAHGVPAARLHRAASMADAVNQAVALAPDLGHVTLSPACSSFDMFDSYAHRGRVFQEIARGLGVV